MTRDVLARLDAAGIGIASATFEVLGLPPLRVEQGSVPNDRLPHRAGDGA